MSVHELEDGTDVSVGKFRSGQSSYTYNGWHPLRTPPNPDQPFLTSPTSLRKSASLWSLSLISARLSYWCHRSRRSSIIVAQTLRIACSGESIADIQPEVRISARPTASSMTKRILCEDRLDDSIRKNARNGRACSAASYIGLA